MKILDAFDAWTLSCAVGAENGTVGTTIGYRCWKMLSKKNWMPGVKAQLPWYVTEGAIEKELDNFVSKNRHRHHKEIYDEINIQRDAK